ncbi:MAG TPA: alpha/beta hydrolase [Bdellovibrionales bacterium]|nr:alpha/beta hydrolase [Bdellovibrionales bacterium]
MLGEAQSQEIKKTTGTFESFDGTSIYYEVRGSGRPIILCYGLACLINHWTHQIKYFSQNYQTIVFDYRGHHQSGMPADPENLSIDAICKDMKALCEHLGIKKASFWGHSLGVQYLLRFYDLFPELVDDMVFINGFAKNPIKGMFGIDALPNVFKIFKDVYQKHPTKLAGIWKAAVQNPIAIPLSALAGGFNLSLTSMRDIEVYARGVASVDLEVFTRLFEEMMEYDASAVLDKIEVPVLIVSGSKDGVTPVSHQIAMHERIKGSQLLRVPYGSHCTQLDLPDYVNLRAEKFLNEIGFHS